MTDQSSSFPDSNVIRDGDQRYCHISSILPITTAQAAEGASPPQRRTPIDYRVCLEASAFLALKHLADPSKVLTQRISSSSAPSMNMNMNISLADRLRTCDIQFSMRFYDSQFSSIEAARQLQTAIHQLDRRKRPFALLGSARSSVSMTLATLASAYELPQLSPSSTSEALDDKARAPYFARTVPTNAGDAQALILYLKEQLGVVHFGIYFIQDTFGMAFHTHLTQYANYYGLKPIPFSYDSVADIPMSMANLAATDVRYILGVFNPSTWQDVLLNAKRQGLIGAGYTWLLTEASLEFTDTAFQLDRSTQIELAEALHGTGILTVDILPSTPLDGALRDLFANDTQREEFYQHHADPTLFDNWEVPESGCGTSSIYSMLAYDAVLSLGVAACETPTDSFTGPEFYQQLLRTEFEGVSGMVSFDTVTGTRATQNLSYRMANLRISNERSTNQTIVFDTIATAEVLLTTESIRDLERPFVYADNTTQIPSPYPPSEMEENLMGAGVRATGLAMGSLVAILSLYLLGWLVRNRNEEVIRASQPIFLCQILVGTIIIVSALIPLSLQEPISQNGLDIACASAPWLISIGFVTAFSALFAKLWRLNRIFGVTADAHSSNAFTRRIIRPIDVVLPFVILVVLNITILTSWTIVNPRQWQRIPMNSFDSFGRVAETYGACAVDQGREEDDDENAIRSEVLFATLLLGVNGVALICALYQTWLTRKLPSEFSDVTYIGMSFVMMFEASLLGAPIILLIGENPSSLFLTQSILLSLVATSMLIPILAKYRQQLIYRVTDSDGRRQRYWLIRAVGRAQQKMSNASSRFVPQMSSLRRLPTFGDPVTPPSATLNEQGGDAEVLSTGTASGVTLTQVRPSLGGGANNSIDRGTSSSWSLECQQSPCVVGQARVRRTRDFYEQRDANHIRSNRRSETRNALKEKRRNRSRSPGHSLMAVYVE